MTRPFKILQVDHTGITVRDIEASLRFWHEMLGFKLLYRARRSGVFAEEATGVPGADIEIAVVLGPGHKIELLQYLAPADRAAMRPRPCDLGSVHLAFDVDDLDAAIAAFDTQGWAPAGTPQVIADGARAGTRIVYLRDADGTTIELMQPPMV